LTFIVVSNLLTKRRLIIDFCYVACTPQMKKRIIGFLKPYVITTAVAIITTCLLVASPFISKRKIEYE
jgi:hypothetical protein